jgi:hypothetical protein
MKQEFFRKSLTNYIYRWSPEPNNFDNKSRSANDPNKNKDYCSATPFSNGEDWKVTYTYLDLYNNSTTFRSAYVACDYVE